MARPKKNDLKDRLTISFTEYDEEIYDYLKGLKNASALVRHLVRQYMEGGVVTPPPSKKIQKITETEEDTRTHIEFNAPIGHEPINEYNEVVEEESVTQVEYIENQEETESIFTKRRKKKESERQKELEDYKYKDDLYDKAGKLGNMGL